jgi:hypothetical protein
MKRGFEHSLLLLALAAPALAACIEEDIIENASFDRWCGTSLCSWTTDRGRIERVPSWHREDYAVSFVKTPTRISQLSNAEPVACLHFDMMADVAAEAGMVMKLDFNDDGIIEFDQEIPAVRWQSVKFVVRAPESYVNARFIVEKLGKGRAVLGQVAVRAESDCEGPRIELVNGSSCAADASCASKACVEGLCSACAEEGCATGQGCKRDADCASGACAGELCSDCAKDGSCPVLARCDADKQCESGACVENLAPSSVAYPVSCGPCKNDADCGGDENSCVEGQCKSCDRSPLGQHCGECRRDADCGAGKTCLNGFCSSCGTDADCSDGETCRYQDKFDALVRACTSDEAPRALPRGALCENSEECGAETWCGGRANEPKRCGVACEAAFSDDAPRCPADTTCIRAGVLLREGLDPLPNQAWEKDPGARVATCYPFLHEGEACVSHEQCPLGACCDGKCDWSSGFNPRSGACTDRDGITITE